MEKFHCFIIGKRYPNVTSINLPTLEKRFDINRLDPIMITFDSRQFKDSLTNGEFLCYQARNPLPGEIGCALSHLKIYKEMVDNNISRSLIIEDDAEITNASEFLAAVDYFFSDDNSLPAVYSLYTENFPIKIHDDEIRNTKFIETKISPPTTVAYLINIQAAKLFLQAQNPIRYVADWPYSGNGCKFYLTTRTLFIHHNSNSSILIPNSLNRELRFHRKISIWSLYWFFKNRRSFKNLSQYIEMMIRPRFLYHTKNLRHFSKVSI